MNEYLRRIDERDYLTEREHREYLKKLESDLEILEILKKNIKSKNIILVKRNSCIEKDLISSEDNDKIIQWLEGE